MFPSFIIAPTLGSYLIVTLFGTRIGTKGSVLITISNITLSFFASLLYFFKTITNNSCENVLQLSWISSDFLVCSWGFLFDSLTGVMLIVITSVSTLVHFYSAEYMKTDPHLARFMSLLSLFTFFMIVLVTSNNVVQLFVGWEGVGFCSFLLINFWFTRLQANKSAIKAMIVNRIGDLALIIAILLITSFYKTTDYLSFFSMISLSSQTYFSLFGCNFPIQETICLFLFIGAAGKSAQLVLHTWLPDAMEGPTPVSALIHAATMVTAGVFLLIRFSPLFEHAPVIMNIIIVIGASTAFFAATVGLFQNDLKRIIAYSTCSQLGYMMFACGTSNYTSGAFHLVNHAFFKALLFLSAGSVIHALSDEQDIRKMGGLRRILPFTYLMFLIGSMSLMGFPFLSGFYSKDAILEGAYAGFTTCSHFAYWLGTATAFVTSCYSMRLFYFVFFSSTNSYKKLIKNAHDAPVLMAIPLCFLAVGSVFSGYLLKDLFIGLGSDFLTNSTFINPLNFNAEDSEFITTYYKNLPVFGSILSVLITFIIYNNYYLFLCKRQETFSKILLYNFLNRKYLFDKVYNEFVSQNLLDFSYKKTYKLIDRGLIEFFGPKNIYNILNNISLTLLKLQTGSLFTYIVTILVGICIFFFIFYTQLKAHFLFLGPAVLIRLMVCFFLLS